MIKRKRDDLWKSVFFIYVILLFSGVVGDDFVIILGAKIVPTSMWILSVFWEGPWGGLRKVSGV